MFDPAAVSNFSNKHPFIVQAWDASLDRWLDTIHGAATVEKCLTEALPVAREPGRWMRGQVGRTRVVRTTTKKHHCYVPN